VPLLDDLLAQARHSDGKTPSRKFGSVFRTTAQIPPNVRPPHQRSSGGEQPFVLLRWGRLTHLQEQLCPCDVGERMTAARASPIYDDGASLRHEHIVRMVVAMTQDMAVRKSLKLLQGLGASRCRRRGCLAYGARQPLTLRRQPRDAAGVH